MPALSPIERDATLSFHVGLSFPRLLVGLLVEDVKAEEEEPRPEVEL